MPELTAQPVTSYCFYMAEQTTFTPTLLFLLNIEICSRNLGHARARILKVQRSVVHFGPRVSGGLQEHFVQPMRTTCNSCFAVYLEN